MILDLSRVLKAKDSTMDFDSTVQIGKLEFNGEQYDIRKPVVVKGIVANAGDILELKAITSGNVFVRCDRCMKEIQKDFSFKVVETLTNEYSPYVEEAIRFEGFSIDMKDIVIENILINISMKHLCSNECKGLCSVCGTDLNVDQCACIQDDIDPRLEILKKWVNK